MDVCCIFEPIGPLAMKIGFGRYRDSEKDVLGNLEKGIIPTVTRQEYSIEWYSKKTLKLMKLGVCDGLKHKIKWIGETE